MFLLTPRSKVYMVYKVYIVQVYKVYIVQSHHA